MNHEEPQEAPEFTDEETKHIAADMRRKAAENVKAAREAYEISESSEISDALEIFHRMAEKATGLSRNELSALALEPREESVRMIDPRKTKRRRMEQARAPELHIRNLSDNVPVECDAIQGVRTFLEARKKNILVLSGGKGTCKTGSACWALGERSDGIFVKAKHLSAIAIEDKALYLRLSRAPLIVLDELGLEHPDEKGFWLSTFIDLFDDWYSSCATVIITGNLTRTKFEAYDERVFDRLREVGEWKNIGGASVRGAKS